MDQKENLIDKDLSLVVVLPGGVEKTTTVHGSKPLMDLLVTLCATYHLNPSSHTLELVTAKRSNIKLKPSALIGTLDAEKIILKPKGEDKNKKTSPQMPEDKLILLYVQPHQAMQATTASAPASPVLVSKPRPLSMALPSTNASSPLNSPTIPADVPKKRRAPQPPILVSQSCSSDPSVRRRLNSEPNSQLDGDQMTGLSRGSSAESSLKRTKRKAPPPPTSPSAVVHETVPLDENVQGGSAANTLEEIMEQEETLPSVMSATAGDTQAEDSSLSMSADVSLHSQSPDTEIVSTASMEGSGEDQSRDLSSDGNHLQSGGSDSATLSDTKTAAGTDSSELADINGEPSQDENVSQEPVSEVAPCCLQQPAEAHDSLQTNTEILREETDRFMSPVAISTSRPIGEDAQVQTDFTPLPVPPQQQHMDEVPSAANAPATESAGKNDAATLTHIWTHLTLKNMPYPTPQRPQHQVFLPQLRLFMPQSLSQSPSLPTS
ncbi:hypothetical protein INR49_005350 [Caranx melampygus]|nr:hypothetical protein INR49_005350 [Caranx melampygus]